MRMMVRMGEMARPKGAAATLLTEPKNSGNVESGGKASTAFFLRKKAIAANIVTACPITVAQAAPAMPHLGTK